MLGAVHYGNEDIYRATLFALPWLAVLAGFVNIESKRVVKTGFSIFLVLLTFAYIIGDMGFDNLYVTRPSDIEAAVYFETHAPIGSSVIAIGSYRAQMNLGYRLVTPSTAMGAFLMMGFLQA